MQVVGEASTGREALDQAQKVLRRFAALPGKQTILVGDLTPREQEVLILIAEGYPTRRSPKSFSSARRR